MTVAELIKKLQELPQEQTVKIKISRAYLEGSIFDPWVVWEVENKAWGDKNTEIVVW